eukprot:m.459516 g.459516  ORF g.459516 m.459516 type:complete len:610 (-) comp21771_c0_seq1:51-1880(-)
MLSDAAVLWTGSDTLCIEDVSTTRGATPYCTIDRVSMAIAHHATMPELEASATKQQIHGIVGFLNLISGPFLIAITGRGAVGRIYQHTVWQLKDVHTVQFARNRRHLSASQLKIEDKYLEMVLSVFDNHRFYFSYSYDLTHGLQRLHTAGETFYQETLYKRMDRRFCWNQHFLVGVARNGEMGHFLLPIMAGFVEIVPAVDINGHAVEVTLISRRAVQRAGTRFTRRGIDRGGAVANFVETEQIVQVDGDFHLAYVQTRGSIPLFWSQTPTLRYKPPVVMNSSEDHELAARRHFTEQLRRYGKQSVISLTNTSGHEGQLTRMFGDIMSKLQSPHLGYYPFDFHKECSWNRWDRLSILMKSVRQDHSVYGAFMAKRQGEVVQIESFQQGVFRTNCIDCLDRSNVVQSMIARETLDLQFRQLQVFQPNESVQEHPRLKRLLDDLWADNADVLSVQYGGSKALKTDFTRTGKRTMAGRFSDFCQSALRYYMNNLADGYRQDAIDVFLGHYKVQNNEGVAVASPVADRRESHVRLAPVLVWVVLVMLLIIMSLTPVDESEPDGLDDSSASHLFTIQHILEGVCVVGAFMIYRFSDRIVDYPALLTGPSSLAAK